jgi:hypothetical protein
VCVCVRAVAWEGFGVFVLVQLRGRVTKICAVAWEGDQNLYTAHRLARTRARAREKGREERVGMSS